MSYNTQRLRKLLSQVYASMYVEDRSSFQEINKIIDTIEAREDKLVEVEDAMDKANQKCHMRIHKILNPGD